MRKMMIYNLWCILISYSLVFNGNYYFGILLELLLIIYNLLFVRKINYWRFSFILLLTGLFSLTLAINSDISNNKLIFPFLVLVCINSSIVNEICYKLKALYIMPSYTILSISFLIFTFIAILIPYSPLLPTYKTNLYAYIGVMFVPSFMSMSICLFSKLVKKKEINASYVLK